MKMQYLQRVHICVLIKLNDKSDINVSAFWCRIATITSLPQLSQRSTFKGIHSDILNTNITFFVFKELPIGNDGDVTPAPKVTNKTRGSSLVRPTRLSFWDVDGLRRSFLTMRRMTSLGIYAIGATVAGTGFGLTLQCLTGFFGTRRCRTSDHQNKSKRDEKELSLCFLLAAHRGFSVPFLRH